MALAHSKAETPVLFPPTWSIGINIPLFTYFL